MQIKAPQITSFVLPLGALNTGIAVSAVAYFAFAPAIQQAVGTSPLFTPALLASSFVGHNPLLYMFYVLAATHVLEAGYTSILCRRHQTGPFVGVCNIICCFRRSDIDVD